MKGSDSTRKIANSLVALSSAAVLAVYTAGYLRTRSAADRYELEAAARRPVAPPVARAVEQPNESAEAQKLENQLPPAAPVPPTQRPSPPKRVAHVAASPTPAPSLAPDAAPAAPEPVPVPTERSTVQPLLPDASAPAAAIQGPYNDGTYFGWGTSRHGDIQAAVVIEDGRIASATIARCLTRYSCSVIAALPPQVASRQSPNVDYVSGATQSANAFYYAVVEALSKAK